MTRVIKQGERLVTTTVRIVAFGDEDMSTGTGFYYSVLDQSREKYCPVIVTNKHVVENMKNVELVLTKADKEFRRTKDHITIDITELKSKIIYHPDVDLCAISLYEVINELKGKGIDIHTFYVDRNTIPSKEVLDNMDAIEDILMVGYPDGLWDPIHNMPVVRQGITASHPSLDYKSEKEFLIDCACMPGSSGSPIYYLDKAYKTSLSGGCIGYPEYLLGILYGGPITCLQAQSFDGNPIDAYVDTPINLGNVIKAERVLELEQEIVKVIDKEYWIGIKDDV